MTLKAMSLRPVPLEAVVIAHGPSFDGCVFDLKCWPLEVFQEAESTVSFFGFGKSSAVSEHRRLEVHLHISPTECGSMMRLRRVGYQLLAA